MIDYWLKKLDREWNQTMTHTPWAFCSDSDDVLCYPMLAGQLGWHHIQSNGFLLCFDDATNARDWAESNKFFFAESITLMGAPSVEIALFCQRKKLEGYKIEDRGATVPCR